jgi:ribosomal protein S4
MQLFAVSVKAATPFKSRGEISVKGEGCDTPSITVVATMFYNTSAVNLHCILV